MPGCLGKGRPPMKCLVLGRLRSLGAPVGLLVADDR